MKIRAIVVSFLPITSLAAVALHGESFGTLVQRKREDGNTSSSTWCVNDAKGGGLDDGCSQGAPICTSSLTGQEVPSLEVGDRCVACVKVSDTNSLLSLSPFHKQIDSGCNADAPRCATSEGSDPVPGSFGTQCCSGTGSHCQQSSSCASVVGPGYCLDALGREYPICAYDGFVCHDLAESDMHAIGWEQYHGSPAQGDEPQCYILYSASYVAGKGPVQVCPSLNTCIGYNFDQQGQGKVLDSGGASYATCYSCTNRASEA